MRESKGVCLSCVGVMLIVTSLVTFYLLRLYDEMSDLRDKVSSYLRSQLRLRRLWFQHTNWKVIVFTPVSV